MFLYERPLVTALVRGVATGVSGAEEGRRKKYNVTKYGQPQ